MTDQPPATNHGDTLNPRDAELAVLAAAWWQPDLTTTLPVAANDFYSPIHEALWHTLTNLHNEGLTPDGIVVLQRLPRQMRSAANQTILDVVAGPSIPANAPIHAQAVHDANTRRTILSRLDRARQLALALDHPIDGTLAYLAETAAGTDPSEARQAAHDRAVNERATRLRIDRDARNLLATEQHPDTQEPDAGTLAQILARPPEPPHRVEGLIPSDASTLLVAQRKTGKTTLLLNYTRCLLSGEHFLGQFPVRPLHPHSAVAFLNFEVSAAQLARWAHDIGINPDRLYLENLRGRRNPLAHPTDRAALAERLQAHHTEALIVDPFGRAYTGLSQNDPGEVGAWLTDLDLFTRTEVGATDLILATHAGWNAERSRGASALEDWPDSIITLTRDDNDNRFIRAMGRDVELDEDRLLYDPATRWLSVTGDGSRKQAADNKELDHAAELVADIVEDAPGITAAELERRLRTKLKEAGEGMRKGHASKAAARAEHLGYIHCQGGRNGLAKHYFEGPQTAPEPSPETGRGGSRNDPPNPPTLPGEGNDDLTTGNSNPPRPSPTLPMGTVEPSPPDYRKAGRVPGRANTTTQCATCGTTMKILFTGQTTHPGCEPRDTKPAPPQNTRDEPDWLHDPDLEPPF
ncbi:MAG: AAA family ATPase [Propionicimonas sp.]